MFKRFSGSGSWVVLGLMSGTSLDGMDAARVRFTREDGRLRSWELLAYREGPFPAALRGELGALVRGEERSASAFARLHVDLARAFANFVLAAFPGKGENTIADLAAFPGHTLWHDPAGAGFSFQIGSPSAFASLTGIPTVGDFRLPDVLLGGQGAPLVPLADAILHRDEQEYRALVNLGGIANLTLLPPGEGVEGVRAWDTGPGNTLLDLAAGLATGEPCDRDGRIAAAGSVRTDRLREWLAHPWFGQAPPKSTGRELFGGSFLGPEDMARELEAVGAEDLLATLAELTVEPIVGALSGLPVDRLCVAGGGTSNAHLMSRLAERLTPLPVLSSDALGMPPAAKEAVDFALLALEAAAGRPVALPAVTGARRAASAGLFSPGEPSV